MKPSKKIVLILLLPMILGLAYCTACFLALNTPCNTIEVCRCLSPDGHFVAIVEEIGCGATVDYQHNVSIFRTGSDKHKVLIASFYGACRNASAYGVNLTWASNTNLKISYYKAKTVDLSNTTATIGPNIINTNCYMNILDEQECTGAMNFALENNKDCNCCKHLNN